SFDHFKDENDSGATTILNVPLRVGGLLTRSLELEGEVLFTHYDSSGDSGTGTVASGHLLYHFATRSRIVPFLLAGGGFGDCVAYAGLAADQERGVAVLEGGAGVKGFFGDRAALRVEYRFTRFSSGASEESTGFGGLFSDSVQVTSHRLFVGVSVWFK